jgi:hypothetical protein
MPRIAVPTTIEAPPESRALLEAAAKRPGWAPNLFRPMAISPNTLSAFMALQGSLARTLDIQTIEAIGMAAGPDTMHASGRS